jgi:hypothetical protein
LVQIFIAAASPDEVSRADGFIAAGTVRDLTARARHLAIATMLGSGISAAHAEEALGVLMERTGQVEALGSVDELTATWTGTCSGWPTGRGPPRSCRPACAC